MEEEKNNTTVEKLNQVNILEKLYNEKLFQKLHKKGDFSFAENIYISCQLAIYAKTFT